MDDSASFYAKNNLEDNSQTSFATSSQINNQQTPLSNSYSQSFPTTSNLNSSPVILPSIPK